MDSSQYNPNRHDDPVVAYMRQRDQNERDARNNAEAQAVYAALAVMLWIGHKQRVAQRAHRPDWYGRHPYVFLWFGLFLCTLPPYKGGSQPRAFAGAFPNLVQRGEGRVIFWWLVQAGILVFEFFHALLPVLLR